jgi:hypothetical protein
MSLQFDEISYRMSGPSGTFWGYPFTVLMAGIGVLGAFVWRLLG